MPPDDANVLPDSAIGLTNIHDATGMSAVLLDTDSLLPGTREAIASLGYELGNLVEGGIGATSIVVQAVHRRTNRRVAIKIIKDLESKAMAERFQREHRLLRTRDVPTDVLPAFYDFHDGSRQESIQPFLVLEYIKGTKLLEWLARAGSCPLGRRLILIERIFEAVGKLHAANLLHGDGSWNNILVQEGDVVRLIDLGVGKQITGATASMCSVEGPKGTPVAHPKEYTEGNWSLTVGIDIFSAARASFFLIVGYDKGSRRTPEREQKDLLATTRIEREVIPARVVRILIRALREPAPEKPKAGYYTSAADVARDLRGWREGQARWAALKRQVVAALLVAVPTLALAWVGWSNYLSEFREDQNRQMVALRRQADGLSHGDHPRVKLLAERADELKKDRKAALNGWQTDRADALAPELLDTLRQEIALRQGLERCLPLRQALGEVLTRAPWVKESAAISRKNEELTQDYTEIASLIEVGDTEAAWVKLGKLNAALAELARRNVVAMRVAEPRARLKRTRDNLSAQLRERGAADPAFRRLNQDADAAEKAWKTGDWPTAERHFGLAQQALDTWLAGKETPEELAARRAADGSSALDSAQRELALRGEVERLEGLQKDHDKQIQTLRVHITGLTEQNLRDRNDLTTERSLREKAEAKAGDLSRTLGHVRATSEQTAAALAAERTAKETALRAKATAETERAVPPASRLPGE